YYGSALDHITLAGRYTWLDCRLVADRLRNTLTPARSSDERRQSDEALPTFLYAVHRAMRSSGGLATEFANAGKVYRLCTSVVERAAGQKQLSGSIRDRGGSQLSRFQITFDPADAAMLPVTIEFRPKSLLTLRFEKSVPQPSPTIRSLLREEPA